MTEKVVITACIQKGLTKKGNPYYSVNLADGRKATVFDQQIAQTLNQEIEVEIKQTEYNGAVEYVINPVGQGSGRKGGGFNLGFNQAKTAIECAVQSFAGGIGPGDAEEVTKRADWFLQWIQNNS